MVSLPVVLKQARKRLKLTRAEVVERLSEHGHPVGVAAYGHWERGARIPSYTHLERLALILKVPLADLCRAAGITERQRLSDAEAA